MSDRGRDEGGTPGRDILTAGKELVPIVRRGGEATPGWSTYLTQRKNFSERYKEHPQAPSPIFDHSKTTRHSIKLDNFSLVGRESQGIIRTIKEAMYMRANDHLLNTEQVSTAPHLGWSAARHTSSLFIVTPYSIHTTNPLLATTPNIMGGTKFFLGVSMFIKGRFPSYLPLPSLHLAQIPPLQ